MKLQKKQFKTIAKYMYEPELHGEWADFTHALAETFELVDNVKRVTKRRPYKERKPRESRPIPEGVKPSRNHSGYKVTVHRASDGHVTICGTRNLDAVTTFEDEFVTCRNCMLPKNQRKLDEVLQPTQSH